MDPLTFGNFLKERRAAQKLTQAELAEKLHVTPKAVSRWERGVGFPDIQSLEPLAQALDLSLLELMQSRMIPEETVTREEASAAVADTLLIAGGRKKGALLAVTYFCILFILVSTALLTYELWFYVESPWLRGFGMMAIFLLNHLCVNGVNGLLQRISTLPNRPSKRQIAQWIIRGLITACILASLFTSSFSWPLATRLRLLMIVLLIAEMVLRRQKAPPHGKE